MAVAHLGENRNKGLSAVPKLFSIYVDRAKFDKIGLDIWMFKLDGKRLLANLANFLKIESKKQDLSILSVDELDDCSNTESSSSCDSEEQLNSINENDDYPNIKKSKNDKIRQKKLSPLKDKTNEANLSVIKDYDWIKRKKAELSLLKNNKFHTFNQLVYYSTPKPHLNSLIFSTQVFQQQNSNYKSQNSPSISLPSLCTDSFSILDKNLLKPTTNKSSVVEQQIDLDNNYHLLVNSSKINIIPYSTYWLYKLIDFDEQLNGYNRAKIVRLSVNEANSTTKLAVIGEQIVGYAIIKQNIQDIYLIAPLYANSKQIANDLIKEFVRSMNIEKLAKGFVIKLPSCNQNAIELMKNLGFEKQIYSVTRCFTGKLLKKLIKSFVNL